MGRTLFISDVHLAGERPATSARFFDFLRSEAARAGALYILGDLFEYWIGDDDLGAADGDPLTRRVATGLRELTGAGVAVHVMHGNRDFLIGSAFCAASGARLVEDPALVDLGGIPTLLAHGDTLCTDDHDYQAWRRVARSETWQRDFLAKPLGARRSAVGEMRERSKAVIREKPAAIMDVNAAAVSAACRAHGVRRLIHGHTHRPAHHEFELDGAPCERWVLPDWYGPGGYLAVDGSGARMIAF